MQNKHKTHAHQAQAAILKVSENPAKSAANRREPKAAAQSNSPMEMECRR